jgi:hypothetical protein
MLLVWLVLLLLLLLPQHHNHHKHILCPHAGGKANQSQAVRLLPALAVAGDPPVDNIALR